NPFCTLGPGSTQLRIYAPNNGARIGDFFRISGATAFDVFTEDMLNREFQVVGFYNEDEDYLVVTAPAVTPSAGTVCGGNDNGTASAEFDISSGLESAVVGKGWGIPPWGGWASTFGPFRAPSPPATGWGEAFDPASLNPVDPTINQLRLWSLDNFGEDLVACIRNGPIFYWHQTAGLNTRAIPLNQAVNVGGV